MAYDGLQDISSVGERGWVRQHSAGGEPLAGSAVGSCEPARPRGACGLRELWLRVPAVRAQDVRVPALAPSLDVRRVVAS